MVKWGMVGQVLGHQFEAGQVQQSKWAKRFEWWSDVWKKHEETLWRLNQNDRNKNTRFWDYAPQDRKNTWQVSLQLCVCVCVSVCVSHPCSQGHRETEQFCFPFYFITMIIGVQMQQTGQGDLVNEAGDMPESMWK